MPNRNEAKEALDAVIRKSRVHLYKPIPVSYTHLGTNCVTARDASVIRSMSYMSSHSRRTRIPVSYTHLCSVMRVPPMV